MQRDESPTPQVIHPPPGSPSDTAPPPERSATETPAALVTTMPGPEEQNAEAIAQAGPEGRPTDPKAGPGAVRGLIVLSVLLVAAAAVASVWWLGWGGLILALIIGVLALVMNPAIVASRLRADDRERVLRHEGPSAAPSGPRSPRT